MLLNVAFIFLNATMNKQHKSPIIRYVKNMWEKKCNKPNHA